MIYVLPVVVREWFRASTRTECVCGFTSNDSEVEVVGPVKVALAPSNLLLTIPGRCFHGGTFH